MSRLDSLKKERKLLESMLLSKHGNGAAGEAYKALRLYFNKIDSMEAYNPLGRVRLVRLFLESNLSDDKELFSCYGRFANLVEGVEV